MVYFNKIIVKEDEIMIAKLTNLVIRFKWVVLCIWVSATILLTLFAPNLSEILKTDNSSFLPNNSKTANASKLIKSLYPDDEKYTSFVLVISRDTKLSADDEQYIKNLAQFFAEKKAEYRITDIISPFTNEALKEELISKDGLVAVVNLRVNASPYTDVGTKALNDVKAAANSTSLKLADGSSFSIPSSLQIQVTGDAAIGAEQHQTTNKSMELVTRITVILLLLILIFIYRSPVAPFLPLFTIGLSFLISKGIIGFLTLYGFKVSSFTETFLIAVLFGAGTDYCMLIISRFKEELSSGMTKNQAILASMPSTSEAIISSGGTVIIGFLFMIFAKFGLFNTTGPSVAVGVAVTILAVLTLIPALISILGKIIFWPTKNFDNHKDNLHNGFWAKLAAFVTARPIRFIIITLIVFIPFIIASTGLKTSFDAMKDLPAENSSIKGFTIMSQHFSEGELMPVKITIKSDKDMWDTKNLKILDSLADNLLKVENVYTVRTASRPLGKKLTEASLSTQISMLSNGLSDVEKGLTPLNEGIKTIQDNINKIESGIRTGANGLNVDMVSGLDKTIGGINTISSTLEMLSAKTSEIKRGYDGVLAYVNSSIASLEKLKTDQPALEGNADFQTAYQNLNGVSQSFKALQEGLVMISGGIDQTKKGLSATDKTNSDMISGIQKIKDGVKLAGDNLGTAANGLQSISQGLDPITKGIASIGEGLSKITDETSKYSSGDGVGDVFYLPNGVFEQYPEFKKAVSNYISANGNGATMDIVLSATPYSTKALDTISEIERAVKFSLKGTDLQNAEFAVSGVTAAYADIRDFIAKDMLVVIIFVLLGIFVILALLLRSLIAPIYLILTILLSYVSTLGVSYLLFCKILGQDGLHWSVPFFSFCVLVALGVDYNIFLMSRVKEEYVEGQMRQSITRALATTGGIITSCGLIMAGTFGAMLSSPLRPMMQIGFAACFGLIIDTFIIRSIVVPAISVLVGEMNWWPGRKIKVLSFKRDKNDK